MREIERFMLTVAIAAAMGIGQTSVSAQVYGPGDTVLAIDTDGNSSFPPGETPFNATDQNSALKYLNFGGAQTGLIITPFFGSSVVRSLQLTTANDFEERDPSSYVLYGTNDPITSMDNSLGDEENWIMISAGSIVLPAARLSPSEIVDFANAISYSSYKLIFPTLKSANLFSEMQIADVQLYTAIGGGGLQILSGADFALAANDDPMDFSLYPEAEIPTNTIDGTLDKYLNFGFTNSGFIIRRADSAGVIIDGFTITTANDFFERDPSSYELYGTNDPITSMQNSTGTDENWTLVASGPLDLPVERNTESAPVAVTNSTSYSGYRVLFPTIRAAANSMQIAEMTFTGEVDKFLLGDINCDGIVSLLDVQPFVTLLASGGFSPKADINGDGIVSLLDINGFVELLAGG